MNSVCPPWWICGLSHTHTHTEDQQWISKRAEIKYRIFSEVFHEELVEVPVEHSAGHVVQVISDWMK